MRAWPRPAAARAGLITARAWPEAARAARWLWTCSSVWAERVGGAGSRLASASGTCAAASQSAMWALEKRRGSEVAAAKANSGSDPARARAEGESAQGRNVRGLRGEMASAGGAPFPSGRSMDSAGVMPASRSRWWWVGERGRRRRTMSSSEAVRAKAASRSAAS